MPDASALEQACIIGMHICREAIWHERRCTWTADRVDWSGSRWTVRHGPMGADLYSGNAGIALFLARLHTLSGEVLAKRVAEAALCECMEQVAALHLQERPGYYTGLAGIAHACLVCARDWQSERWEAAGLVLLHGVLARMNDASSPELLAGRAGIVSLLLRWREHLPADQVLAHARALARPWLAGDPGPALAAGLSGDARQRGGFAHGLAGVVWSLDRLAACTHDAAIVARAEWAWTRLAEVELSAATAEGWPSAGRDPHAPAPAARGLGWCNGASGWTLAALHASHTRGRMEGHCARALAQLAERLAGLRPDARDDFSLCHGLGGLLDTLLDARGVGGPDGRRALPQAVLRIAALQTRHAGGEWRCGLPVAAQTFGLLQGWAGIGDLHLRCHAPDLPSVLLP